MYEHILGKWTLVSKGNYFEALHHIGCVARELVTSYSLEYKKSTEGKEELMQTLSNEKLSSTFHFTPGKEFTDTFPGGATAPAVIKIEGNVMVQKDKYGHGHDQWKIKIVRVFDGDQMTSTVKVKDKHHKKWFGINTFKKEATSNI